MAQEFSRGFYKSQAWKTTRASYWRAKRGLCEDCLERGEIVPGDEVHHLIELTPDNVNNPAVALNWSNLRLLCRSCHRKRHEKETGKRYIVDQMTGDVRSTNPPMP